VYFSNQFFLNDRYLWWCEGDFTENKANKPPFELEAQMLYSMVVLTHLAGRPHDASISIFLDCDYIDKYMICIGEFFFCEMNK